MFKKIIIGGFLACSVLAWGVAPSLSSAQNTSGDSAVLAQLQAQIQSLLAQIQALQAQIAQLQSQQGELRQELRDTRFELRSQLREGSRGEDVRTLQEILATDPEIYPEGFITGYFGVFTKRAVEKFQKKFGIEPIGIVGPKTMARINQLLTEGAGKSGKIPPGLLRAPGIQKKLAGLPDDDDDEVDNKAPRLSQVAPADDATGVAVDANLVLTFSEVVVANTGNISIKKESGDSVVETIAVGSVSGSGSSTITVNPTGNLASSTAYYVFVDANAFKDIAGNMFAGINSKTIWNFTTAGQ